MKIQYAAFVATARPGETRTRRSCSAEQGNRVQVPDMGPEPAGFRFRSCDCGALVRARRRALRKRVIGTAVMAGREGRTSALGISPERISQKTYTSKNRRGACASLGSVWCAQKQRSLSLLFSLPAGGKTRTHRAFARLIDDPRQQLNSCGRKAYRPRGNRRRDEPVKGLPTWSSSRRTGAQEDRLTAVDSISFHI